MFEKEAEEYSNNLLKDVNCNIGNPRARQINSIDVENAYKDGANIGYNKGYNKAKEEMQENGLALQSDMDKTIEQNIQLKNQIEKMKCCSNCSHFKLDNNGLYSIFVCELTYPNKCKNNNKWELRR